MRIHPISLALRCLRGEKTIYGRSLFASEADAADALTRMTGKDFGTDAKQWGEWLRHNRWVYQQSPEQWRSLESDRASDGV